MGIRVEKPGHLRPALERALAARCPVIVDVVTDIEALAPLAGSDTSTGHATTGRSCQLSSLA